MRGKYGKFFQKNFFQQNFRKMKNFWPFFGLILEKNPYFCLIKRFTFFSNLFINYFCLNLVKKGEKFKIFAYNLDKKQRKIGQKWRDLGILAKIWPKHFENQTKIAKI